MFSDDARTRRRGLLAAAALALASAGSLAAPQTHCHPDEKVFFTCVAGKKMVSLCGQQAAGKIVSLAYRYGFPGKVENEFVATGANGRHFLATVEADAPRAAIGEVWFSRGEYKYLLTACRGGDCPYEAGLAVLRGERVVSNSRCQDGADSLGGFSTELIEFGDSNDHSRSATPLLKIDDYSHPVDQLYPVPGSAFR